MVHGTLHLLGYDHMDEDGAADMEAREVRALARLGIADPYGDALMATRNEEEGGSRLWRGMRALLFGEDGEATLRDQIEDAIDEADAEPLQRGDL